MGVDFLDHPRHVENAIAGDARRGFNSVVSGPVMTATTFPADDEFSTFVSSAQSLIGIYVVDTRLLTNRWATSAGGHKS
jgi:hypothetical protein